MMPKRSNMMTAWVELSRATRVKGSKVTYHVERIDGGHSGEDDTIQDDGITGSANKR